MGKNFFKSAQDQLLNKENEGKNEIEDSNKSVKETALEEAIRSMFEELGIEMRSDVNKPMILAMSRGDIYVEKFGSKVMEKFMHRILVRSVSFDRKGRAELVALVRNSQDVYEENNDMASAFARVMTKS